MINAKTKLCMSIGDPISGSLSPVMHNAGLKKIGLDDLFVYVAVRVPENALQDMITAIRTMDIKAVSVTMPHKQSVMQYLDEIDEKALKIGAVNTIINTNGMLKGYNTDWLGAVNSLKQKTLIKGKRVALIGAGGAARAISYGIIKEGGILTIFNRTKEKGDALAKKCGGTSVGLDQLYEIQNMDIIINSTSVGMGNPYESPIDKKFLNKHHIVFDIVYYPRITNLLKDAKEKGAAIVYGIDMLLYQGVAQFEMYTKKRAPIEAMRSILVKSLNERK